MLTVCTPESNYKVPLVEYMNLVFEYVVKSLFIVLYHTGLDAGCWHSECKQLCSAHCSFHDTVNFYLQFCPILGSNCWRRCQAASLNRSSGDSRPHTDPGRFETCLFIVPFTLLKLEPRFHWGSTGETVHMSAFRYMLACTAVTGNKPDS